MAQLRRCWRRKIAAHTECLIVFPIDFTRWLAVGCSLPSRARHVIIPRTRSRLSRCRSGKIFLGCLPTLFALSGIFTHQAELCLGLASNSVAVVKSVICTYAVGAGVLAIAFCPQLIALIAGAADSPTDGGRSLADRGPCVGQGISLRRVPETRIHVILIGVVCGRLGGDRFTGSSGGDTGFTRQVQFLEGIL